MKVHLTHEELTDRLLGGRSATVEAHLLECPECSGELQSIRKSIQMFRGAAHAWSEARPVQRSAPIVRTMRRPFDWLLAGAVAALVLFFCTLLFMDRWNMQQADSHKPEAVQAIDAAQQLKQDNELLTQIDAEISEALPAPMQPLQPSASQASVSDNR